MADDAAAVPAAVPETPVEAGRDPQQGQAPMEKPSFAQLMMKIGVLYMSFMFFTQQFNASRVKDAVKVMQESEEDEVSTVLKPVPKEDESFSWMKEVVGIQSSKIPQFPEYDARGRQLALHRCTFNKRQKMDLHVYMTDSEEDPELWLEAGEEGAPKLLWKEEDLIFMADGGDEPRSTTIELELPPALLNNGSAWAHIYLSKKAVSHNPENPLYREDSVAHHKAQLNKFLPKPKKRNVHYLVVDKDTDESAAAAIEAGGEGEGNAVAGRDGDSDAADADAQEGEMVNFWKPTLHLAQIDYNSVFQRNHIPATFAGHITFHQSTGNYHPMIYVNEFWLQKKHLIELNSTVETLPLELSVAPMSIWKFQTMSQLETQWAAQSKMGLAGDGDQDSFRELLANTNPFILGVTMLVTLLHTVFNFLAFKNDISFWKDEKRSLEGISVRGMLVNLFFQVVIFLYLMDNDTTSMVLMTNAIGLAIEVWKIGRFIAGKLDWGGQDGQPVRIIPKLTFRAREVYRKSKTKEFDDIATHHLLYVVAPLMVGYAAYSLMNQQHKGWYSWVLSSLVGFVYMFGFVMMTPQLFINYKLKSVAHMPWRVMTYKSINTFIDDLFAFIVPMPTLHRIACFRDDLIFFVFLYQRYLYPVDKSRRNEFGQSAESAEDAKKIRAAQTDMQPRVARVPRRSKTDKLR